MPTLFPYLHELVAGCTEGLSGIQTRRMFGCDALFVADKMFVLFWKTGRIGVKLLDQGDFTRLMAVPGAEQWHAGAKAMSSWVLVPEDMHDDAAALAPWVRRAYDQARTLASMADTLTMKAIGKGIRTARSRG